MGSGGEAPPPCTPSSCLHRCVQGYIWEAGGALLGMSQRLSGSDVCSGVLVQWWGGRGEETHFRSMWVVLLHLGSLRAVASCSLPSSVFSALLLQELSCRAGMCKRDVPIFSVRAGEGGCSHLYV